MKVVNVVITFIAQETYQPARVYKKFVTLAYQHNSIFILLKYFVFY
jgi:hypothetical protein